jgi:hypothetical protein
MAVRASKERLSSDFGHPVAAIRLRRLCWLVAGVYLQPFSPRRPAQPIDRLLGQPVNGL